MLQSRVRAGERDMEITFLKKVVAGNTFNEDKETSWELVDEYPTVFAKVTEQPRPRGNEVVIGERISAVRVTLFFVAYRQDISPENNRIYFDGKVFNIVHVTEGDSRREVLRITAELIDNGIWS